jgi:hypothetical protein
MGGTKPSPPKYPRRYFADRNIRNADIAFILIQAQRRRGASPPQSSGGLTNSTQPAPLVPVIHQPIKLTEHDNPRQPVSRRQRKRNVKWHPALDQI